MDSLEVMLVHMYFHAFMYPNAQCVASKESTFHISYAQNVKQTDAFEVRILLQTHLVHSLAKDMILKQVFLKCFLHDLIISDSIS